MGKEMLIAIVVLVVLGIAFLTAVYTMVKVATQK